MNLKNTDVFSGIGVFALEMIIPLVSYFKGQNGKALIFWTVGAILFAALFVYIRGIKKDLNSAKKEKDDAFKKLAESESAYESLEQETYVMEDTLYNLNEYLSDMSNARHKLLYAIKNRNEFDEITKDTVSELTNRVLEIFEKDIDYKASVNNVSVFLKNKTGEYYIYSSLKHSRGTIRRLKLEENSFVGNCFLKKERLCCPNIDNRGRDVPFAELEEDPKNRKYLSIWSIPGVIDEQSVCALVVTSSVEFCLDDTYKKYKGVIDGYVDLLSMALVLDETFKEV